MMVDTGRFEEPGDDPDGDYSNDDYSDDDGRDDEGSETLPCPECGAEVYEDAVRCPHCGAYVTWDTRVWSGRPVWWIVLGILGVLATILVLALSSGW